MNTTRETCLALDDRDPLAALRGEFQLPEGVIYLDGNSLGVLPRATPARIAKVVQEEWGRDLIRSWNTAGWVDLSQRIGNKIARLVGAGENELIVGDSTSVNLYKALCAAIELVKAEAPQRRLIVSERSNFPTDLYIAESVARTHGLNLKLIEADDLPQHLNHELAVLMLTHVNYRTGRLHDMAQVTQEAHKAGALVLWDLAHSAGAVPVDLTAASADFAVGCGYKYLNGGPGAPAFVWAHPRHTARMDRDQLRQPLSGWFGHAAPFEFTPDYRPALGIQRFACGTPPVLSMSALDCGIDVFLKAEAQGGMAALRKKSIALTTLFIELVEARCADHGLTLVTPREAAQRGSQVSFAHEQGYAIMQALITRSVIGDFRAGEPGAPPESSHLLRFGFTPLYTRFTEVWDAVEHLRQVLTSGEWREARFNQRAAVT
ncbi:MAG: kynureninase [Burkholderiales bacterium]|nr:kynureninase [Burkholderiales bacterium]